MSYTAKSIYHPEHPTALALYCSDGRFTEPVEELLRHLGHARLDTCTMPGGPALFNTMTASFGDLDAARRGAKFLIEGHKITEAILIAHAGCGYYRKKFPTKTAEQVVVLQHRDLRNAGDILRRGHEGLVTHLYFARVVDATVVFDLIANA